MEGGARREEYSNRLAIRRSLKAAVEFINENGGGPGVRLRKPDRGKSGK